MLLEDFKNLVDMYSATFLSNDIEEACRILGIDTTYGYTTKQVKETLYSNIREAICTSDKNQMNIIEKASLVKLQSDLIYRYILFNENPTEYLIVLDRIKDSCNHDEEFLLSQIFTSSWKTAIENVKNLNIISPHIFTNSVESLKYQFLKEIDIANSAKKLIDIGCEVDIKDSKIYIISGLREVIDDLIKKIEYVGGIPLIESLFYHLVSNGKYSEKLQRYFFTREANIINYQQRPQIPYGFLLNMALKYPYAANKGNSSIVLREIVEIATYISNIYGVQQYSFFEYYFQDGETVPSFYSNIVLWDTMFSISQCRPSYASDICENLFAYISDEEFERFLNFKKNELLDVLEGINSLAKNIHSSTVIFSSVLDRKLNHINKEKIKIILNLFSHQTSVNKNYVIPSEYTSIDFWKKPLIKLSETKFVLMNKVWCAPNYYEAIVAHLRKKLVRENLESELGLQLEVYVQKKLQEAGISFKSGDYEVGGKSGECDFLIESEKAIILIELKKKVLTGKAKSGIDTNLFIDLSESVLDAQIQAGRTEIILIENGNIKLTDKNGITHFVELNNRSIERVALTQLEFSGLHDRSIFIHLLKALVTHSYSTYSVDPQVLYKFSLLNDKRELWVEQYNKLCQISDSYPRNAFFNCWFLSLPQLLEVINSSLDNDSFYEIFRGMKHITSNTLDWYKEFENITNLRNASR